MPFVMIRYNSRLFRAKEVGQIVEFLPRGVADVLSVPGTDAELQPSDIEVEVREFGPLDVTGKYALTITVLANHYPARQARLKDAATFLLGKVKQHLPESVAHAFVWILLAPGGFAEC
jgi:hypothetical protein